ncbi:gamma-glutamyltransferase [Parendozoicomonas sp. Alg238-R29]|uniref:gamma-glutamyltransferase n=1 Tax=Parendozoicomonas sp. Alg238-R29 TaxID=2993446 RepID=UPI00248E40CC|nr:gamma-glutamyltransferase [Parendozoicomonas sp. Alg238-R29]
MTLSSQSLAEDKAESFDIHKTVPSGVFSPNGMVATSEPLAVDIGLDILKKGGNAIDAAIAVNAALGLMEPTGSGIGGDLFAIVWSAKDKKLYGLNASGYAPSELSFHKLQSELKRLNRDDIPPFGMLPITVPGAVDGWFELHSRFGSLSMADILAPAIHYAKEGFPVTPVIAKHWWWGVYWLTGQPGSFVDTFTINGKAPKAGEIFRNPDLARTYQIIADKGRDAFYKGSIAKQIDEFMRKEGGFLRFSDLAAFRSEWVEPVSTNYRGFDIWELPPNGQGITVLQMLNILEGYDLSAMERDSGELLHLMIEAKKLAFEDRARFYADTYFRKLPIKGLLSKDYARSRRGLIGDHAAQRIDAGNPYLYKGDTVYITTADSEGNMVSLIQSNYRGMGSGVVVPGLGFTFQDRGQLFSMDPDHANVYAPRKRPFHTIIPAFMTKNRKPLMSFGLMGGAMQPQGHVQVLVNLIDLGMNLQEAGDNPRWRHDGSSEPTGKHNAYTEGGGKVMIEPGFSPSTAEDLELRGHKVKESDFGFGGYQAIWFDEKAGGYYGATERRKDGKVEGY